MEKRETYIPNVQLELTPEITDQLILFALQEHVLRRGFETPIVTEVTQNYPLHMHRITKDDFAEGL